jgi:hypothetical protein
LILLNEEILSPPPITSSLRAQAGEFEVAITGGIWAAAGVKPAVASWQYAAFAI